MASTSENIITFNSGISMPVAALAFAIDLDLRGIRFTAVGDTLRVYKADGGRPNLSQEDADQIRRWKLHLLHLVEMCDL